MYNWDKDSDDYLDAVADAKYDRAMEGYYDFCEENDLDPDDPESRESFLDAKEYSKNPMKYYGVSWSDFI